jgi:hypothetical protein
VEGNVPPGIGKQIKMVYSRNIKRRLHVFAREEDKKMMDPFVMWSRFAYATLVSARIHRRDILTKNLRCVDHIEVAIDICIRVCFFFISPLQRARVTSRLWRFVRNELPVNAKATIGSLNLLKNFSKKC